jgi:hypothetical protein
MGNTRAILILATLVGALFSYNVRAGGGGAYPQQQQQTAPPPLQMQQPQQSGAKPLFRTSLPGSAIKVGNRSNTLNANQIVKTRLGLRLSNNLQPGTRSKPSPTRGFPLNRAPGSTDSSRVFRTGIFISLGRSLGTGRPGRRR